MGEFGRMAGTGGWSLASIQQLLEGVGSTAPTLKRPAAPILAMTLGICAN